MDLNKKRDSATIKSVVNQRNRKTSVNKIKSTKRTQKVRINRANYEAFQSRVTNKRAAENRYNTNRNHPSTSLRVNNQRAEGIISVTNLNKDTKGNKFSFSDSEESEPEEDFQEIVSQVQNRQNYRRMEETNSEFGRNPSSAGSSDHQKQLSTYSRKYSKNSSSYGSSSYSSSSSECMPEYLKRCILNRANCEKERILGLIAKYLSFTHCQIILPELAGDNPYDLDFALSRNYAMSQKTASTAGSMGDSTPAPTKKQHSVNAQQLQEMVKKLKPKYLEQLETFVYDGGIYLEVLVLGLIYLQKILKVFNLKDGRFVIPMYATCVLIAHKFLICHQVWPLYEFCKLVEVSSKQIAQWETQILHCLNFCLFISEEEFLSFAKDELFLY